MKRMNLKKPLMEKEITAAILHLLREHGAFCFKHWSGPMSRKGVSDILGVLPTGQMIAVEVKRPGGRPTKEQIIFIEDIRRCGGLAFVADSVDIVRTELQGLGISPRQKGLFG